jgi:hypothetical protein
MVVLDEMAAVFAEVSRKGSSPINMALLPITKDGYEVERVEKVAGYGGNPGGNVLHLRIRGRKVRVWSRAGIDRQLQLGLSLEKAHSRGKRVELVVIHKAPMPNGKHAIEATLRLVKNPQAVIQLEPTAAADPPQVAEVKDKSFSARLSELDLLLDEMWEKERLEHDPPAPPPATPVLPELEDDDPIVRPPRRGDGKAVHFWRGAEFNHGSELLLATAISRFSESMPPYSGLVAIPNGVVLLKGCRKTHRKLDFLVVLNENGSSITACVEVDGSSHDGRYLGDEARQDEFTLNGFHHIKRYSAEKVMAGPDAVVQELVAWMRSLRGTGTTGGPAF